jgi:hypothetical protein
VALVATWLGLLMAGVAGLGLGIGVVIGSAIVRDLRGRNGFLNGGDHRR